MINYIIEILLNPTKAFTKLLSGPRLRDVIILITLLFSASVILAVQKSFITYHEQSKVAYVVMVAIALTVYLLGVISFFIESIYIKLILSIKNRREKLGIIATLVAYAMVPSILYSWILVFFPNLLVTSTVNAKLITLYSKISLGYLLYGYSSTYPIIFNIIKQINIFSVWTNILEVVALSILGRFSYSKALLVLTPYWLCSALIPVLLA